MMDREKVIKGLEWCMNEKHDCYREKGCPYENEGEDIGCKYALHRDALALLKAQEPVDYIPIDWLMNYAQLPTEFAISAWRKPKKEAEIKQAKSLDKPMSLDDALELLKAQEPRVMTLEEALGSEECWLERKDGNVTVADIALNGQDSGGYDVDSNELSTMRRYIFHSGYYGKYWRCWTSRPTDEQRKAVKWE